MTTPTTPDVAPAVKFKNQKAYVSGLIRYKEEALHLRDRVAALETKVETLCTLLARSLAIEPKEGGRSSHAEKAS